MSNLASLDILLQALSNDSKISIVKRSDLLWDLYLSLIYVDKKSIKALKDKVIGVLKGIANQGSGSAMNRMLFTLYSFLIEAGEKSILSTEVDAMAKQIVLQKTTASLRLTNLEIIGRMYNNFAHDCGSISIIWLSEQLNRVCSHSEWFIREAALTCLSKIVKTGMPNMLEASGEIIKMTNKMLIDKNSDVRFEAYKVFSSLAKVIRGKFADKYLDNLFEIAVKGLEDEDLLTRKNAGKIIANGIKVRLSKFCDEISINELPPKINVNESPKNLLQIISYLNKFFAKASQNRTRDGIIECIAYCFEINAQHLLITRPTLIANEILLLLSKTFENEKSAWRARNNISWLFNNYCKLINSNCLKELLNYSLQQIEKLVGDKKPSRKIDQQNQHKAVILLEAATTIFEILGEKIQELFPSVNSITDIILPCLSHTYSWVIRKHTIMATKALALVSKSWLCQMLSLLLNMTTIANAELAGSKSVNIFRIIDKKTEAEENASNLYITLLNAASCLALLFKIGKTTLKGIPLDISNAARNAAFGMIIGSYHLDEEENTPSKYSYEQQIEYPIRRVAGWILLQGLCSLGNPWLEKSVNTIFNFFCIVFDPSPIETNKIEESSLETIIGLMKIRTEALKTLLALINQLDIYNYQNRITDCIGKALDLLCVSYAKYQSIFKDKCKAEYEVMQQNLLTILNMIPISFLNQSINLIIQLLITNLTSLGTLTHLQDENISPDDLYLIEREAKIGKFENCDFSITDNARLNESNFDIVNNYNSPMSEWWDYHSTLSEILSYSILILAKIICCSSIPMKTKEYIICQIEKSIRSINPVPEPLLRNFGLLCISVSKNSIKKNNNFVTSPLLSIILNLLSITSASSSLQTRLISIEAATRMRIGLGVQEGQLTRIRSELNGAFEKNESAKSGNKIIEACSWIKNSEPEESELESLISLIESNSTLTSKIFMSHLAYIMMKFTGQNFEDLNQKLLQITYKGFQSDLRFEKTVTCASAMTLYNAINKGVILINDSRLENFLFDLINIMNSRWKIVCLSGINLFKISIYNGWCKNLTKLLSILKKQFQLNCLPLICGIIECVGLLIFKGNFQNLCKEWPEFILDIIKKYDNLHLYLGNNYFLNIKKYKKKNETMILDDVSLKISKDKTSSKYEYSNFIRWKIKQLLFFIVRKKLLTFQEILNLSKCIIQDSSQEGKKPPEKSNIIQRENIDKVEYCNSTKSLAAKLILESLKKPTEDSYEEILKNSNLILTLGHSILSIEPNRHRKTGLRLIRAILNFFKLNSVSSLVHLDEYAAVTFSVLKKSLHKTSEYAIHRLAFPIAKMFLSNKDLHDSSTRDKIFNILFEQIKDCNVYGSVEFSSDEEALYTFMKKQILFIEIVEIFNKDENTKVSGEIVTCLNKCVKGILTDLVPILLNDAEKSKELHLVHSSSLAAFSIDKTIALCISLIDHCSSNKGWNENILSSIGIDKIFRLCLLYSSKANSIKEENLYNDISKKIYVVGMCKNIIQSLGKLPSNSVLEKLLMSISLYKDYQVLELSMACCEVLNTLLQYDDNLPLFEIEKILIKSISLSINKKHEILFSKASEVWIGIINLKIKLIKLLKNSSESLKQTAFTILCSSELNQENFPLSFQKLIFRLQYQLFKLLLINDNFLITSENIIYKFCEILKLKILNTEGPQKEELVNNLISSFVIINLEIPYQLFSDKNKDKDKDKNLNLNLNLNQGLERIYNELLSSKYVKSFEKYAIQILKAKNYQTFSLLKSVLLQRCLLSLYQLSKKMKTDQKIKSNEEYLQAIQLISSLAKQKDVLAIDWIFEALFNFIVLTSNYKENYEFLSDISNSLLVTNAQKFKICLTGISTEHQIKLQTILKQYIKSN